MAAAGRLGKIAELAMGCVKRGSWEGVKGPGWRAGEPIGLWTQDYRRKPAYAGFADGLGMGSSLINP